MGNLCTSPEELMHKFRTSTKGDEPDIEKMLTDNSCLINKQNSQSSSCCVRSSNCNTLPKEVYLKGFEFAAKGFLVKSQTANKA